jgi:hypothetical protein
LIGGEKPLEPNIQRFSHGNPRDAAAGRGLALVNSLFAPDPLWLPRRFQLLCALGWSLLCTLGWTNLLERRFLGVLFHPRAWLLNTDGPRCGRVSCWRLVILIIIIVAIVEIIVVVAILEEEWVVGVGDGNRLLTRASPRPAAASRGFPCENL